MSYYFLIYNGKNTRMKCVIGEKRTASKENGYILCQFTVPFGKMLQKPQTREKVPLTGFQK